MASGRLKETSNFTDFANLTVEIAAEFGKEEAKIVRDAWDEVGVKEKSADDKDDGDSEGKGGCNPM